MNINKTDTQSKSKIGIGLAIFSYVMWGFLPIFWNLLEGVDSLYILSNRIIWSLILVSIFMLISKRFDVVKNAFKDKSTLINCLISGLFCTANWGIYIFAVNTGHVLETSLGYFIEPIIVISIGVMLFKEKMRKLKILTLIFAIISMIYLLIAYRVLPLISLGVALTFAVYGTIKKRIDLSADVSLFVETLCVSPLAIGYIIFSHIHAEGAVTSLSSFENILFPLCGFVTLTPLLLFAVAVKLMPYHYMGIIMYISPSITFFLGVFLFKEPLDITRLTAFIIIWIGILFTIIDAILEARENK